MDKTDITGVAKHYPPRVEHYKLHGHIARLDISRVGKLNSFTGRIYEENNTIFQNHEDSWEVNPD